MADAPSPLYVMLPPDADDEFMQGALRRLLARVPVAALLIWTGRENIAATSSALSVAHEFGVPLFLAGPIATTSAILADGVHVEGRPTDIKAALAHHAPARMVGAGNVWNRHDAMQAGESGADYVLFGSADPERSIDHDRIRELCVWWSQMFEIPCVAIAGSIAGATELLDAGADFVALRDAIWSQGPKTDDALAALVSGAKEAAR